MHNEHFRADFIMLISIAVQFGSTWRPLSVSDLFRGFTGSYVLGCFVALLRLIWLQLGRPLPCSDYGTVHTCALHILCLNNTSLARIDYWTTIAEL